MENPRPEKVAVVDEVRERFQSSDAVIITEYRGLTVRDLQDLRSSLRDAGGDYRVYKNTLVRRATESLDLALGEHLLGPTALTFVGDRPDGTAGDVVTVAKALKAFAKSNPLLVLKGGVLGGSPLDESALSRLAEVAPREELLARLAGGMAAPMQNFASLLNAIPQKMAYALQALIEQGGAGTAGSASTEQTDTAEVEEEAVADTAADTPTDMTDQDETPAEGGDAAEANADDAAQEQE